MTDLIFKIYKDDTSPSITFTLLPLTNLVGASVTFTMEDRSGNVIVDAAAATINDAALGIVRYAFQPADTALEGEYKASFKVTYADASIETFPNDAVIAISIRGGGVYAVSSSEVLEGFSTSASAADIAGYIAIMDQADACLTAKGVSGAIGKQLKVLGIRHLAANASDRGAVTQERAVSGASRTYKERKAGETGYLETLRTIDQYGCVLGLINKNAYIQLRSVGRTAPVAS
jgi:hypothetical protein